MPAFSSHLSSCMTIWKNEHDEYFISHVQRDTVVSTNHSEQVMIGYIFERDVKYINCKDNIDPGALHKLTQPELNSGSVLYKGSMWTFKK
jgi:hypothetical protein